MCSLVSVGIDNQQLEQKLSYTVLDNVDQG
uniref:Uncharacterized protein n=1 Tax=Arundo donax TaxID=35708 RepID=A0A0A8YYT1_ARUDO